MLLELDPHWNVRPFPFDWREDVDGSADRLGRRGADFGAGEPVHLVAHSMGGLVSRRFIQRHPDVVGGHGRRDGQGRGGRLVMLGTPNHGSFAIPLTLTGAEKLVKLLARADLHHGLDELLAILGTFPGLYDMLPSPDVELGDDHGRLSSSRPGGRSPRRSRCSDAPAPDRGASRRRSTRRVSSTSPATTSSRLRRSASSAGQVLLPPDARRRRARPARARAARRGPHVLGARDPRDLAKNVRVLDAITDLLERGTTARLPTAKPAALGRRPGAQARLGRRRHDRAGPSAIDEIFQTRPAAGPGPASRAPRGRGDPARKPCRRRLSRARDQPTPPPDGAARRAGRRCRI